MLLGFTHTEAFYKWQPQTLKNSWIHQLDPQIWNRICAKSGNLGYNLLAHADFTKREQKFEEEYHKLQAQADFSLPI